MYPFIRYTAFEEIEKVSFAISLDEIDAKIEKIGKLFICRKQENITVYDAHCTHMGCVLNFDSTKQKLICPCHSSEFSLDGKRLKGPATRDLDIIKSKVVNNILYVG